MLRRLAASALLLLMIWSAAVSVALAQVPAAAISLVPSVTSVAVGETFQVAIQLANLTDVVGADVKFSFDPARLQVVDADPATDGVQVAPGPLIPGLVGKNVADNAAGTVWFAVAKAVPGVNGGGTLATVTFRATATGTATLGFPLNAVELLDSSYAPVPYNTAGTSVNITATSLPPASVQLVPSASSVGVGQSFQVEIRLDGLTDVVGAEVKFNFDPARLQVVDADPATDGVQVAPGPLIPGLVGKNAADNAAGTVWFAVAKAAPGVNGGGTLATVTFQATATGTATLGYPPDAVELLDSSYRILPYNTIPAGVTIVGDAQPPVWPEGSTLTAALVAQNDLVLTWTPASGAAAYHVYRDGAEVARVDGAARTYAVSGLAAGTTYTFKVEASNADGLQTSNGPSHTVTTAPATATAVLRLVPSAATVGVSGTFTVDVMVENVTGLAGTTLNLVFDPSRLQVLDADTSTPEVEIAHGTAFAGKSSYTVTNNVADNSAGTILYNGLVTNGAQAVTTSSASLARITFRALAAGPAAVGFSLAEPTVLGAPGGVSIPVKQFVPAAVSAVEGGFITGQVTLEGQADHSGIRVAVLDAQNQEVASTTTDGSGAYTLSLTQAGTYTVTFSRAGWSFVRRTVSVTLGGTATMPPLVLIRGDMNADGFINVLDLLWMAEAIGTRPGGTGWKPPADVNGDTFINVLDLLAVAANIGRRP